MSWPNDKRWLKKNPTYHRDWLRERRRKVLAVYGDKCICCNETTLEFLTIDHVDGLDGRPRESLGVIYTKIIVAGFQPEYQVLCYNCNNAKAHYEQCPHQIQNS